MHSRCNYEYADLDTNTTPNCAELRLVTSSRKFPSRFHGNNDVVLFARCTHFQKGQYSSGNTWKKRNNIREKNTHILIRIFLGELHVRLYRLAYLITRIYFPNLWFFYRNEAKLPEKGSTVIILVSPKCWLNIVFFFFLSSFFHHF